MANSIIRQNIQKMSPYSPPLEGRANCLLLDFNERTVPPSKIIKEALEKIFKQDKLQIYPEYRDVNEKIAKYEGVKNGETMMTNGSDQAIDIICRACLEKGDEVIIPTPSFAMYYQSAEIQGAKMIEPLYNEELKFPTREVLDAINEKTKLIIICNPNNPTGTTAPREDIIKILGKAKDIMVMVDEAYSEYTNESVKDLIDKYPNLCITKTFSKAFGFPSLRAGYIISSKSNIDEFLKIRGPYDVNVFATAAIEAALEDTSYVQEYVDEVMTKSKPMVEEFFTKNNIKYWPSKANFILFKPNKPEKIFNALVGKGVRTRPRKGPNVEGTIRMCIGTVEQMKKFIEIYQSII